MKENLFVFRQKEDHLITTEFNHYGTKSINKGSYRIPSPTILVPEEFFRSSKLITTTNKNRNL